MFHNLNAEMARFNVDKPKLAEILNLALPTLYARLSSGLFTCAEACIIRDYFNNNFGTNFTMDYLFSLEPVAI